MRLLQRLPQGDIVLNRKFNDDELIPPYAILSHMWGADDEEVVFDDINQNRVEGRAKLGYQKIKFCCERAAQDGLNYFWVDSCCINKDNEAELQHAISSMFDWYRRSTKCYVYMSDVSATGTAVDRERAFRKSRWFRRGWTLQELLAPSSVEFFSKEALLLGDTHSLEKQIHEITGIPHAAIQGGSLSQFTVAQRMSWVANRETKLPEDLAYSLMGIFGVNMPLRYDEGKVAANDRLEKQIEKQQQCLRELRLIDPCYHKKQIEQVKGGLLRDSYSWILDNCDYRTWYNDNEQSRTLWIKGDPGKGKTMLLCGIIDELEKTLPKTSLMSYFFFEAADSRANTGTAMLRGLMYTLICQQPSLVVHMLKKYDYAGKVLFEDSTAWYTLSDVFLDILRDPNLRRTYLVVDALDECMVEELPRLLEFFVKVTPLSSRIKWLVSSRNIPLVEEQLQEVGNKMRLCLELNADSVSAAVHTYIQHKVRRLVHDKGYDGKTREAILTYLYSKAEDTFLWVALVCDNLKNTPQALIPMRLESFPPGLSRLYNRMLTQVCESRDAELCKRILSLIAAIYESIHLAELSSIIGLPEGSLDDVESLQEIINLCGSFLVVRDCMVSIVHKSAKDYLCKEASSQIFPCGVREKHHKLFIGSLEAFSQKLYRNMYNLHSLHSSIQQMERPSPDPLAKLRYRCLHWIDHLCESDTGNHLAMKASNEDRELVNVFMRKTFLYWLEAISLCQGLAIGVLAISKLEKHLEGTDVSSFHDIVRDARRFIMYHKQAIEVAPLQVYISGLLFSPSSSLIRQQCSEQAPDWIKLLSSTESRWSACLQTFEGHGITANSVVFSHDSTLLASGSDDCSVRIWDVDSGACTKILRGHGAFVSAVAFSHDSMWLASASGDHMVMLWNVNSGACLRIFRGHSGFVTSVVFSSNSKLLVSASDDCMIMIWNSNTGGRLKILKGHSSTVTSVAISHDSAWMISASHDRKIRKWDIQSGACQQVLTGHSDFINSVAISHNSLWFASTSDDHTARIWNADSGACLRTLAGHASFISSVAFSKDSSQLVSASGDRTIKIWNFSTGQCLQTLKAHTGTINSVVVSHDSTRLASASHDSTIRIWDISGTVTAQKHDDDHANSVSSIAFSHNSMLLASASYDGMVHIWNTNNGTCLNKFNSGHKDTIDSLKFSYNSAELLVTSGMTESTHSITLKPLDTVRRMMKWSTISKEISRNFFRYLDSSDLTVSADKKWIVQGSEKLVWLPPDYRPSCVALARTMIGIGVGSGKVWLCRLEHSKLPKSHVRHAFGASKANSRTRAD